MTEADLRNFLGLRVATRKREISSVVGSLTQDDLIRMCPLDKASQTQNILIGCLAGIVNFCINTPIDYPACQRFYNIVFANSKFAPIGSACPAWKSGPRSVNCQNAVNNFQASFDYGAVDKAFASSLVSVLFSNPTYAPCQVDAFTRSCNWN